MRISLSVVIVALALLAIDSARAVDREEEAEISLAAGSSGSMGESSVAGTEELRPRTPAEILADVDPTPGFVSGEWVDKGLTAGTQDSKAATVSGATWDVNGDGRSDLTWWNSATRESYLWLSNGTQLWLSNGPRGSLLTHPSWRIRHSADIDGDRSDDYIWYNTATGETYVWLMRGFTIVGEGSLLVHPSWRTVATADLNADGRDDLIWRNPDTGETFAWIWSGSGYVGRSLLVHPDWRVQEAGDLNGDGRDDLIWRHPRIGETYAWLMNGFDLVLGRSLLVSNQWIVLNVGDVSGDRRDDLIWFNGLTFEHYLWVMNGLSAQAQGTIFGADGSNTSWVMTGVADVNGDGLTDFLWNNTLSNETFLWQSDVENGFLVWPTAGRLSVLRHPTWAVQNEFYEGLQNTNP